MAISEALKILAGFRDRGRIDADLFEVFVSSGAYRTYAERFLDRSQIDAVDEAVLLRRRCAAG
jgi:hypothetical protein